MEFKDTMNTMIYLYIREIILQNKIYEEKMNYVDTNWIVEF